ncbi:pirin family protein [Luteimonas huabeiensis]|uniref:pirin family protein n=1 Tax=Luteimonas huabeiensis TaxID=1244513 RepID=UPI000465B2B6|nr:pirin family protein [Luteimonas huabeiensis]
MPLYRPGAGRGRLSHDGVAAVHSFSAGGFVDRAWMGFGALRVLAEETFAPGAAPPAQRRANMRLLTWVRCGALAWSDGDGEAGELYGGGVQLLDAGRGTEQVERNLSDEHPVELLRLWLQPPALNTPPRRIAGSADPAARPGCWCPLLDDEALAPARASAARVAPGEAIELRLAPGRWTWLHVLHGRSALGAQALAAGDAVGWTDEPGVHMLAALDGPLELLRIEVPAPV